MIDLGISKIALIGAVALIVIGPEKLPRVARTVGTLLGKAQRYVADVKAEVNRSMELDELKKMKDSVEGAARDVESSIQSTKSDIEQGLSEAEAEAEADCAWSDIEQDCSEGRSRLTSPGDDSDLMRNSPKYRHPGKKWRLKRGVIPNWYKVRNGVRTRAQSGAARVARFRPPLVK